MSSVTARVVAIDPGSEQSAWLELVEGAPLGFAKQPNAELLGRIRSGDFDGSRLVIERIESYGMAVGREVFETVWWAGRFAEAFDVRDAGEVAQMPRRAVKLHLCGSPRAKDANVRAAILDRFGGSAAKGTKARPGPLYGVSGDVWSALAIGITFVEAGA